MRRAGAPEGARSPENRVTLLLFGLALLSCEPDSRDEPTVETGGTVVVESADADRVYMEIDPEPDLSLGAVDAEGPTQFVRVQAIHVSSDGTIWVAEWESRELRLFDRSGAHLRTVGGRGDGPGEFNFIRLLGAMAGDTVAVVDDRTGRLTWFAPDGEYVRDERVYTGDGAPPVLAGVQPGGELVGQIPNIVQASTLAPGTTFGEEATFLRWEDPGASPDTVGTAPTARWYWSGSDQVAVPFTTNPGVAVASRIYLTTGARPEIRVFDGDGLRERWVVDRPVRPIDSAMRDAYLDFVEMAYPEARREAVRSALESEAAATHPPAYERLLYSESGELWAQRWTPLPERGSGRWDVFGPEGRLRGTVTNPDGLWIHRVEDDAVYGVWTDELGVSYVRRYGTCRLEGGCS